MSIAPVAMASMTPFAIPPTREMRTAVEEMLIPQERILWASRPLGGRRSASWGPLVLAVPFILVGVAGLIGQLALIVILHFDRYALETLFLSPILLLAVGMGIFMIRLPLRDIDRAKRSVFAVTTLRTVRIVLGTSPNIDGAFHGAAEAEARIGRENYRLDIPPMTCRQARDGYGDLWILTGWGVHRNNRYPAYFRMLGIPGPERILHLIEQQEPAVTKAGA